MTKRDRLRYEAIDAATTRGHLLGKFRTHHRNGTMATANCLRCCCTVTIDTKPPPNGIDIGGDAVAIHCVSGGAA